MRILEHGKERQFKSIPELFLMIDDFYSLAAAISNVEEYICQEYFDYYGEPKNNSSYITITFEVNPDYTRQENITAAGIWLTAWKKISAEKNLIVIYISQNKGKNFNEFDSASDNMIYNNFKQWFFKNKFYHSDQSFFESLSEYNEEVYSINPEIIENLNVDLSICLDEDT